MTAENQPLDHVPPEESGTEKSPDIEDNIKSRSTWLRALFMLVCFFLYAITRPIVAAVVVLQFLWALFTSEPNEKLTALGHSLAVYTQELIDYLTYYTEERPFPFEKDWPVGSKDGG